MTPRFTFLATTVLFSLSLCLVAQGEIQPTTSPSLMTPQKQHELFDALNLSSDALKPVAAEVARRDFPKAEHDLAEYFRHRTSPAWKFDAPQNSSAKDPIAEAAVEGRVQGGLVKIWHTFPDNKIDWTYNPTLVTPGLAPNDQWQTQLTRMSFWTNLGDAYRATSDERYTHALIEQFHSFLEQCPPPDHEPTTFIPGMTWWTINVGIRMTGSWPTAFFGFLPSRQFTDEDIALFLDSFLEHGRYLRNSLGAGNALTLEMAGLYTVGAFFPEFKEASDWRAFAVTKMHDEETAQFLPDGAQYELSTLYHNVVLDSLIAIASVAKLVGRLNELPAGYVAGMEKAYDYDLYFMTPARTFPEFNDSTSYHLAGVFTEALNYFPDRPDYQWVASDGTKGHPPAETSHAFSWAGFYVMRSGWEKDANYFVLRAGPLGASHAHQDKLNVILWPYGRQLLYNSGGASYEKSVWRDYSIATFSKNTVLVDGKPQYRDPKNLEANVSKAPIHARWESTPDHDFAAGVYDDDYGHLNARLATHTRRVLFVKPDLFIVADTLVPTNGWHSYQARWNLLTTKTEEDPVTHAVTTVDENKPNMMIVPLQPDHLEVRSVSAQTKPELLGWNVRKDQYPEYVPATTVVHTKAGSGTQSFLTLLVPLRAGSTSTIKSIVPKAPDSATVTFNDGRSISIVTDPKPNGGIEVVETLPNGRAGRHVKIAAATTR